MSNKNRKISEDEDCATMRAYHCATWEENGHTYFSHPTTNEVISDDQIKRMRLSTVENNESQQSQGSDGVLLPPQDAALEERLSHASPGLPIELSQSELIAWLDRRDASQRRVQSSI